jgi:hypothetical protein
VIAKGFDLTKSPYLLSSYPKTLSWDGIEGVEGLQIFCKIVLDFCGCCFFWAVHSVFWWYWPGPGLIDSLVFSCDKFLSLDADLLPLVANRSNFEAKVADF